MTSTRGMAASALPLELVRRGKVRDVYAVGADRLLIVATDRVSAFDVVMAETVPYKGAVLTQLTAWWLGQLTGMVAHHLLSADADAIASELPALDAHRDALRGRTMLCRRVRLSYSTLLLITAVWIVRSIHTGTSRRRSTV